MLLYLREKLLEATWKDASVCCLVFLLIIRFQTEKTYTIKPIWRKMITTVADDKMDISQSLFRLPAPVIADINGDCVKEVLVITNDMQLVVMVTPYKDSKNDNVLPHMVMKKTEKLELISEEYPIILVTQYIEDVNFLREECTRNVTQVIVLLTSHLNVYCYTHNLDLLWKTQLHHVNESYNILSAAITLIPVKAHRNTSSRIIIAVSLSPTEKSRNTDSEDRTNKQTNLTTYAVAADTGKVIWKTGVADDVSKKNSQDSHNWTIYRDYIFPHFWDDLSDTRIISSHIKGDNYRSNQHQHGDDSTTLDVVIVHHAQGVDVLRLATGELVTAVKLPRDGGVYYDLDEDFLIDKIKIVSSDPYFGTDCHIQKSKYLSKTKNSVVIPLCYTKTFFSSNTYAEDISKPHRLVVVPSADPESFLTCHTLISNQNKARKHYDIIVHLSSGRVMSFNSLGIKQWETITKSGWSFVQRSNAHYLTFVPDITVFPLFNNSRIPVALVTGWQHVSLLNLYTGAVISQHTLPCQPLTRVVTGDFDKDGLNEFIVTCSLGYIGFTIKQESQFSYTTIFSIVIFVVIVSLTAVISYLNPHYDHFD